MALPVSKRNRLLSTIRHVRFWRRRRHGASAGSPVSSEKSRQQPVPTATGPAEPVQSRGLGLCDPRKVMSPSERAQLQRDLASMVQARRDAEAKSGNVRLS